MITHLIICLNKAKATSAKLIWLNLKNKVEKRKEKKQYETGRHGEKQKKWKKKTQKNRRKWMILKETGRNMKKHEETGRNRKKHEETGRNRKKPK